MSHCQFCGKDHPEKKIGEVCYTEGPRHLAPWVKVSEIRIPKKGLTKEEIAYFDSLVAASGNPPYEEAPDEWD